MEHPYVVVLGGTETYGRFVPQPYPARVEEALGCDVINLGCVNAGVDVFLGEPSVIEMAQRAEATVVQIVGAHNLTNRFYAVHPRRNDRFLRASPLLRSIFREVDFTEFHFTRHMLQTLQAVSPEKFEVVAEELRSVWVSRMSALLRSVGGKIALLWIAGHPPDAARRRADLARDPLLVNIEMIRSVRALASDYVEVVGSPAARASGLEGMSFGPMERLAAAEVLNAALHREVAEAVTPALRRLL